ncbi:hypothetical protein ABH922_002806 [Rhodococcus sp. 27YEA15]|uniref:hypothetical protein n=1 Tax=Rhodococcus sp. 27YEA15 TaxID=3156259 RepID=UPI003C7B80BD
MLLELLSPERIAAIGLIITGLFGSWLTSRVRHLESEVADLKAQRKKDQGVIKVALRYIRDRISYSELLTGLLRQHAPHVEIPPEPVTPDELKDDV